MKKGVKTDMIQNMTNIILNPESPMRKVKNITIIIISVIFVIIYICNLYYLHNLKNCVCFKVLNIDKKINLNYLLAINYILLFILIINISTTQKKDSSLNISRLVVSIIIILLLISIYSYYIYNIYEIFKKDNIYKSCDCLESNFKYPLYLHGYLLSIFVLMATTFLIITFLIIFIILLIYTKKSFNLKK